MATLSKKHVELKKYNDADILSCGFGSRDTNEGKLYDFSIMLRLKGTDEGYVNLNFTKEEAESIIKQWSNSKLFSK